MSSSPCILWFRHDLRLSDHHALAHALRGSQSILPLFIWDPDEEKDWPPGGASRWWLHHSLTQLQNDLKSRGSDLLIRRGPSLEALREIIADAGATSVVWHRRYEPSIIARDKKIKEALQQDGLEVKSFNGSLLHEPWEIENKSGNPYQVFTPYWKTCLSLPDPSRPLSTPKSLRSPKTWPDSLSIEDLELLPAVDWASGFQKTWQPGSAGALKNLKRFVQEAWADYRQDRDRPDRLGTSRLSPHLHFGEISPRQIWHALKDHAAREGLATVKWRGSQYLAEVGWREFAHHLLYHFPHTVSRPLRTEFAKFPWRSNKNHLRAWQKGLTGYPIVDAGMRELWATGWMHNRIRMVVASFLVKDLLITWQEGAAWFWDTLVDADLANNTLGWQWTAGCGADAAPYFRVFNPVSQGEKFDPQGDYVRKWVPEISALPDKWLHRPWEASAETLGQAGIRLGKDYPKPIVSHAIARDAALDAYQRIK